MLCPTVEFHARTRVFNLAFIMVCPTCTFKTNGEILLATPLARGYCRLPKSIRILLLWHVHRARCLLHFARCTLHVAWYMLPVARHVLQVVCCALHLSFLFCASSTSSRFEITKSSETNELQAIGAQSSARVRTCMRVSLCSVHVVCIGV